MWVERWKIDFSPLMLVLLLFSCASDDKSSHQNPILERHLVDFTPAEDKWGFIDDNGEVVIKAIYDDIGSFKHGLAPVNHGGVWSYIDKTGHSAFKSRFMMALSFEEQVARVRYVNGQMGLFDVKGDTICPPRYDEIYARNKDQYVVSISGKKGVINSEGHQIVDPIYTDIKIINSSLIACKLKTEYFIVHNLQDTLLTNITSIKKGGIVKTTSGWGLLNQNGSWSLQPLEKYVNLGHAGHLIVERNLQPAILNIKTQQYISIEADKLTYLNENRYAKKISGQYQLVNEKGEALHVEFFDSIYKFSEGIAAYEIQEWWGYINVQGDIVIGPTFALPWQSSEGKLRLFTREGFGFHDIDANLIIPPQFQDVRDFSDGLAAFQAN